MASILDGPRPARFAYPPISARGDEASRRSGLAHAYDELRLARRERDPKHRALLLRDAATWRNYASIFRPVLKMREAA